MVNGDGRYVDTSIAVLEGEGAQQQASPNGTAPDMAAPRQSTPGLSPTYYEKPAIKPPVWVWSIPAYFYVGGVAGAAMVMGMAAQLLGGKRLRRFDEQCRWTGAVGGGIGSALLIFDLGRRTRFLYMLRVFRPTSPMSVGSWVLAAATPLSAGSALLTMTRGPLRFLGDAAGIGAGLLGMPLATYTAVLISNSAVPLWQGSHRSLPLLFGASSMAGFGALGDLLPLARRERAIMNRFAAFGRVAELAAAHVVEREAARVERVGRPLRQGLSGALWKAARALTIGSLGVGLLPVKFRGRRALAGVLGTLGGMAVRFAVFHAGKASALDPRATFLQQRALPQPRTREELVGAYASQHKTDNGL